MTKVRLYAIGKSTTLESNKSLGGLLCCASCASCACQRRSCCCAAPRGY